MRKSPHEPPRTTHVEVARSPCIRAQAATDQMKRIYHYLDKPRDLREACPHSVEGMTGHILLLGFVSSAPILVCPSRCNIA